MEAPQVEIVRVGPSLGERITKRRQVETRTLRRLRQALEHGTEGEPWAAVELPAGLLLADVCDALGLSDDQRRDVLGDAGAAFVEGIQETRAQVLGVAS